jgi:hypothetical protein
MTDGKPCCDSQTAASNLNEPQTENVTAVPAHFLLVPILNREGAIESQQYEVYLGSYNVPEFRGCWRHVTDARTCKYEAYVVATHPRIGEIIETFRNCVTGCAIATLMASLALGGAAASAGISAFTACVKACLLAALPGWVNEVRLEVRTEKVSCSNWSNH